MKEQFKETRQKILIFDLLLLSLMYTYLNILMIIQLPKTRKRQVEVIFLTVPCLLLVRFEFSFSFPVCSYPNSMLILQQTLKNYYNIADLNIYRVWMTVLRRIVQND